MGWLVGAGVWLVLVASSHGLARLVVLAAPVAWLAWRSQQRAGYAPRTTRPRSRSGWDDEAGWPSRGQRTGRRPAGPDGQPEGWPSRGQRTGRRPAGADGQPEGWPSARRSRGTRRSRGPRPGWGAGGAAAADPEWDPELDPAFDPEFGVGIDPETGAGWGPVGPGYDDPDPGGPGWDRHAWRAPNGHRPGAPPRTGGRRPGGRTAVAPDLVIATATVAGTAHLRDADGQPVVVRVQVRGPGNLDLERVCRQAVTEAATRGNWWLEAWQPATGPDGWDGAR